MPDELDSLRARAYGLGGPPLSTAEAARLAHLEETAHPHGDPAASTDPAAGTTGDPEAAAARRRLRSAAIGALLLGIGGAGGFVLASALPSSAPPPDPTPSATSQWRAPSITLVSRDRVAARADWDDDSLRLIAWIDDAAYWWGTTQQGELTCLAIDDDDEDRVLCQSTEEAHRFGFTLTVDYFDPDTGQVVDRVEYAFDPYGSGRLFVRREG